jgi:putative oxidoreductase
MRVRDLGLLPARLSLAATMLHHGAAKLGAAGREQTGQFFEQLGFKPGPRWAALVGAAEFFAGMSLALGVATRLGALAVLATQATAVAKVHAPKGFDNMRGGFEFNALIMATALGVLLAGPGEVSVHGLVERRLRGGAGHLLPAWRRLALRRPVRWEGPAIALRAARFLA